ncbi:MAG TPA: hypothetical protein VKW04_06240 [Planctomycetota bacterium]|nr:hypothetical protein [Planctomycetota bacterium]
MMGLLFILSGICCEQDVKAPEFTKWEFARERIGHKVIVDGEMLNRVGADMADVKLTAIYYDGNRELRRSKTAKIAKVADKGRASFTLEADNVPNFTRYELYVEYGPTTRLYVGDEKSPSPTLKKAAPAALTLISTKDALPKSFPGDVVLTLAVRNDGGNEADEPTAVLGFKVRGEERLVRVLLDRSIAAGTEDTFDVTVPGMDAYTAYEARLTYLSSEGPRVPDPAGNPKEVVVRNLRMIRLVDGSGRITGSCKNGVDQPVGDVVVTFQIGKTDVPWTMPGTLAPGELRPFEFYVADCPSFEGGGGYDIKFNTVPKAAPAAFVPPASAKKVGTKSIETRQVKLPPPPGKTVNADPEMNVKNLNKGEYAVGIRGLMVVTGDYGKNNKYTGDVYLLRLVFIDDEGKPMKPTPTINATIYNKDQPYEKIQRIVEKQQWGADASKINSSTVASNTIACDKKSGELWVALVRTETPVFDPRADMTLVIPDIGIWSWKGLSGKFEAAPRPPDRK